MTDLESITVQKSTKILILKYCKRINLQNEKTNMYIFQDRYGRRALWRTARTVALIPGSTYKLLATVKNMTGMEQPFLTLSKVKVFGRFEEF